MNFSESLFWFKEPGFVATLFFCFFSAYAVSAKAKPIVQIVICCYLSTYLITQWAKDDYFSMGMWWIYVGWAGFLFHKLKGIRLLGDVWDRFRTSPSNASQQNTPQPPPHDPTFEDTQRQQSYRQSQAEFSRRQQERASWYQQEQTPEPEPTSNDEPSPTPEPDPEPAEPETPPEPEPTPKRPWWEVLEVPQDADSVTIKKAYRTMTNRYHPDKVSHFGEEFRAKAEAMVKEINGAYDEVKKRF